jgi:hypothetical protein
MRPTRSPDEILNIGIFSRRKIPKNKGEHNQLQLLKGILSNQ